MEDVSVLDAPLQDCSQDNMPRTGYTRDRKCKTNFGDAGSHHVCLRGIGNEKEGHNFCSITGQADWCSDKKNWCVCEWAFKDAVSKVGCDALDIKCDATNKRALDRFKREGMTQAVECILHKCGIVSF